MGKRLELTGQRFGRLVVVSDAGIEKGRHYWDCICDCGITMRVYTGHLRNGHTKSCGCFKRDLTIKRSMKHGQDRRGLATAEYTSWSRMIQRCNNPKRKDYKNYGGRGIKVCGRWLDREHGFENFLADMGLRPPGKSLDRVNNEGDYKPSNCRWATREEQNNNTRQNCWLEYGGEVLTLTQWACKLGVSKYVLWTRINKLNWSIERTLSTPVRPNRNSR